jgi:hypothetical protein
MATAMFEAAQQSNEAAAEECHRRDELLAQLADKVQCQTFWWRAERFEARLEVFYRPGEQLEILACRAMEVDYEPPTPKRRLEIEQRFWQALNEYGALRDELVSRLVAP